MIEPEDIAVRERFRRYGYVSASPALLTSLLLTAVQALATHVF